MCLVEFMYLVSLVEFMYLVFTHMPGEMLTLTHVYCEGHWPIHKTIVINIKIPFDCMLFASFDQTACKTVVC